MSEENYSKRGEILYETPDDVFLSNKKKDMRDIYFALFTLIVIISALPVSYFILSIGISSLFIIWALLIGFLSILSFLSLDKSLKRAKLEKLRVYDDGFLSPTRPGGYVIESKGLLILYDEIKDIEYLAWGLMFDLTLKDGTKIRIGDRWNMDDYLYLLEQILSRFPHLDIDFKPDIKILRDYIKADDKLRKGEISEEEFEVHLTRFMGDDYPKKKKRNS